MYIGGSSPFYLSWTRFPFGRLYHTCGLVVVWFCAVLVSCVLFLSLLCIGEDLFLCLCGGVSSLVHWGGPLSCLTRTRSSERRFVCLLFIAALLTLGCLMSELGTAGQAVCFRRLSIEDPRSFVPSHSTRLRGNNWPYAAGPTGLQLNAPVQPS